MPRVEILDKIPDIDYEESVPNIDLEEFRKVVLSRRSVRVFDGTLIPEKTVEECINLALLAPNSSNLQPWEFFWIRTPEAKAKVVEACFSQPAARTAAEIIVCCARTNTWKEGCDDMLHALSEVERKTGKKTPPSVVSYYEKTAMQHYNQGPLGIFGIMKSIYFFFEGLFHPTAREPVSEKQMLLWATKSAALACENLMLAFRAYGFDSCPMEGFDPVRIRKILDLKKGAYVTMIISAGKRAKNGVYGPRIRFTRASKVKIV